MDPVRLPEIFNFQMQILQIKSRYLANDFRTGTRVAILNDVLKKVTTVSLDLRADGRKIEFNSSLSFHYSISCVPIAAGIFA